MSANGFLAPSELTAVPGGLLSVKTAFAWLRAVAAAARDGVHLTIAQPAGAYRSNWTQHDMRVPSRHAFYNITPGVVPGLPSDHGWGTEVDVAGGQAWMLANGHRFGFTRTKLAFRDYNHWHYDGTTVASSGTTPTGEVDMIEADFIRLQAMFLATEKRIQDQVNIMIQRATRYRLYHDATRSKAINFDSGDVMDNTGGEAEVNLWKNNQLVGNGEVSVEVQPAILDALLDRAAIIKGKPGSGAGAAAVDLTPVLEAIKKIPEATADIFKERL